MRLRLYLCWLALVVPVSLVPSVLYPDIIDRSLNHRPASQPDLVIAQVYEALTAWPIWTYQKIGGSVALPWDWPPYLRMSLTLTMILVPFRFLVGVPFLELLLLFRRRVQAAPREAPA